MQAFLDIPRFGKNLHRKESQFGVLKARVFPVLLLICYLEVLLWTSCLILSSTAAGPVSHSYLLRESGNLGLAAGDRARQQEPQAFHTPPAVLDQAVTEQHVAISRSWQEQLGLDNAILQPAIASLRGILVEEASGLPAPYTGIKAIS